MKRGIYIACDMPIHQYQTLVSILAQEPGIAGLKIGFMLGLAETLHSVTQIARQANMDLKVMYDHQKAGTDVPFTGENFADVMQKAEVDQAILFPLSGPLTQKAWIQALQVVGVEPVVGGAMTHDGFYADSSGYINKDAIYHMYRLSAELGVKSFVMPGNQIELLLRLKKIVLQNGCTEEELTIFSPGIDSLDQLKDLSQQVGNISFYPILGRMIYETENPLISARIAISAMS